MNSILKTRWKSIVLCGLIAGTIDILSAIFILAGGNAGGVFRYIAKGALGDAALQGGPGIILLGALFHYIIAFSFTTGFFLVYPHITLLSKNRLITAIFYGMFVWAFMHYIVLPLTYNSPGPVTLSAWKNIVILMYAIGLPNSIIARAHYDSLKGA